MSEAALISLERLSKIYVTEEVETHALSNVDLEIRDGEYVAIAGPSGCGKSTLLSVIGLLDGPTSGSYRLRGRNVESIGAAERARIRNREFGFIFQAFNLIGELTIAENVELPLTYRGLPAAERARRVRESLERVSMGHRMNHYPWQLSGGQQQRAAVARAIAGRPALLLADEPTGNLDSENAAEVMELISDLHRDGATICMVTHDPRFVAHAGRVVNLFDGHIVDTPGVARTAHRPTLQATS
jgi:putative ABC transport system ATP-binding protein